MIWGKGYKVSKHRVRGSGFAGLIGLIWFGALRLVGFSGFLLEVGSQCLVKLGLAGRARFRV